jgi:tetratricopeptide (TPR) repeat protein
LLIGTLLQQGRVDEAATLNEGLLKASPGDPEGLLFNGRILLAKGQYKQAQTEIEKAVKGEPRSAPGYYFLGVAQNAQGYDAQARTSWAHALELNPQLTIARIALADAAASHGDYDEALRLSAELLKTHPGLKSVQLIRARALIGKGNTKEAQAVVQAELDRNPTSLAALALLVNLRIKEGKPDTLIPSISKTVEQHPSNAGLHYWLAVVYFRSKDQTKAEASAKQAIVLDPKPWEPYSLLAEIHTAAGSVEQAKADLRTETEHNPKGVAGYIALERLYQKEGNWDEARRLAEKAHQIDQTSAVAANDLASLYLEHGGDVNSAVSLAQIARQRAPDVPAAADTLGWAYYKLGSTKVAVTQLSEAVQKDPRTAVFLYHLGMAYFADGQRDSAGQSLKRALATDPNFPEAASAKATLDKLSRPPQALAKK